MSRFVVIAQSSIADGFRLASVETFGVEDVESAEELIAGFIREDERMLVAIEDGLLMELDPSVINRMEGSEKLLYIAIPGAVGTGLRLRREQRIAQMIRRAVGYHITFEGNEDV